MVTPAHDPRPNNAEYLIQAPRVAVFEAIAAIDSVTPVTLDTAIGSAQQVDGANFDRTRIIGFRVLAKDAAGAARAAIKYSHLNVVANMKGYLPSDTERDFAAIAAHSEIYLVAVAGTVTPVFEVWFV